SVLLVVQSSHPGIKVPAPIPDSKTRSTNVFFRQNPQARRSTQALPAQTALASELDHSSISSSAALSSDWECHHRARFFLQAESVSVESPLKSYKPHLSLSRCRGLDRLSDRPV